MSDHEPDDRGPAPAAAGVTRTDLPRQTEFRLVGPAPQTPPRQERPAQAIPAQARPAQPRLPEFRPAQPQPTEPQPTEPRLPEFRPTQPQSTDPQPTQPRLPEFRPAQPQSTEPQPTQPRLPEFRPAQPQPAESQLTEPQPTQPQLTEPELIEPLLTDPRLTEQGPVALAGGPSAQQGGRPAVTQPNAVLDTEPLLSGMEELHAGWQRVKAAFVDNPRGAVAEAAGLADEAAEALAAALRQRRQQIRDTWDGDSPSRDTEALRRALLSYQALFNRIARD